MESKEHMRKRFETAQAKLRATGLMAEWESLDGKYKVSGLRPYYTIFHKIGECGQAKICDVKAANPEAAFKLFLKGE